MPRTNRKPSLETRSSRARIPIGKPVAVAVGVGLALMYRRATDGVGTWQGRRRTGKKYRFAPIGEADDMREADGVDILDYWQAFERTRAWAKDSAGRLPGEKRPTPGRAVVNDALDAYLADYGRRGGKCYTNQAHAIDRFIRPDLGHLRIDPEELTDARIRHWHQDLAASGCAVRTRRGTDVKRRPAPTDPEAIRRRRVSANRYKAILDAALNFAYRAGMATSDAAWRRVKPFQKVNEARIRYLTAPEASRLPTACAPDLGRLVRAGLLSGCRLGELAAMRCGDFHADTKQLHVRPGKTGRARVVPLNAEGAKFFRSLTAGRPVDALALVQENGAVWRPYSYKRTLPKACAAAGIAPAIGMHVLRHTYASLLAQAGCDLLTISKLLGHADTRVTARHYAHLCDRTLSDAVQTKLPRFGLDDIKVVPLRAS